MTRPEIMLMATTQAFLEMAKRMEIDPIPKRTGNENRSLRRVNHKVRVENDRLRPVAKAARALIEALDNNES